MNQSSFYPFLSYKYFNQIKNKSLTNLNENKSGNQNLSIIKTQKSMNDTIINSFKNSMTFSALPDIKNPYLLEFIEQYGDELTEKISLSSKSIKCLSCNSSCDKSHSSVTLKNNLLENNIQSKQNEFLLDMLCNNCLQKFGDTIENFEYHFPSISSSSQSKTENSINSKSKSNICKRVSDNKPETANNLSGNLNSVNHKNTTKNSMNETKRLHNDNLQLYWIEVRNSIYQVFLQEGFLLNSVVTQNMNPPLFRSYVMPPDYLLKFYIKKLFDSNKDKLFFLIICHVNLFIIEIKIRLLKELMQLKPYFIFPLFYTLFDCLSRALERINSFLETIQVDFLKKCKLNWFDFHLLYFQTFVYMNRFIQKSILLLADCSNDEGLNTTCDADSQIVGYCVQRTYMILEKSMASFSFYASIRYPNFSSFFSNYEDFQILFQFAIILFNCKNVDEAIFARKRKILKDFNLKTLQEMPNFDKNSLIKDVFNTITFQLVLVMQNWDDTSIFDIVINRIQEQNSKLSRKTITNLLIDLFRENGFKESTLLNEFYNFIEQEKPKMTSFDSLLSEEINFSDDDDEDVDSMYSENSQQSCLFHSDQNRIDYLYDCDCCYPQVLCHSSRYQVSKNFLEIRERLKQRLSKRKMENETNLSGFENSFKDRPNDDRNLDDLLNFINGTDSEKKTKKTKKKKKKNGDFVENINPNSESIKETSQQNNKKVKNKKSKNKVKRKENNINQNETFLDLNSNKIPKSKNSNLQNSSVECCTVNQKSDLKEIDKLNCQIFDQEDNFLLDDVFKPKDIDLDNDELDEFEKELEKFKRFCYYNSSNVSDKPKLVIDVKEIFAN